MKRRRVARVPIVWVTPNEITDGTLVRDLYATLKLTNLICEDDERKVRAGNE